MNESVRLLSTKNGADKEYRVQLEASAQGYTVTGFNGRRGGALKAQPKTPSPVPYGEAKAMYDDLVKAKLKGGYVLAAGGSGYQAPADIGTPTGIDLNLLKQVPESEVDQYINDDRYLAQPKYDGERRPVARRERVIGSNKNGLLTSLPDVVIEALSGLPMQTELDCEQIGEVLYVFDTMKIGGECQRDLPCVERIRKMGVLLSLLSRPKTLVAVESAIDTIAKRSMYERLRAERAEGIVFKRIDSGYVVGTTDDQVKIKFIESATLQVSSLHPTKRSVCVHAIDSNGLPVPLGAVLVPNKYPLPSVGALVEVEYLYVVRSLVQPVYRGERSDQTLAACRASQLKFRADLDDDLVTDALEAVAA